MLDPNKPRILVALGGRSSERAVSIESGKQVVGALEELGYQTAVLDVGTGKLLQTPELDALEKDGSKLPKVSNLPLIDIKRHFSLVFIAMHGKFGEDGGIQSLFDENGVKYIGSGPLSSALAMNKEFSKKVLKSSGIPVLEGQVIDNPETKCVLQFPVVIKPNDQGSSVGVSICENEADFSVGLKQALSHSASVIAEPYIKGKELTVAVLENENGKPEALPVIEIVPATKFFDFKAKYDGSTKEIVPAEIDENLARKAQDIAVETHRALGCRHFSRTDMIANENGEIVVLELNSIPGLTPESLLPKAARAKGLDFKHLIEYLINISLK